MIAPPFPKDCTMVTVTVTGPPRDRTRVAETIHTALAGSRYIVRRYAMGVAPEPVNPDLATVYDVTLVETYAKRPDPQGDPR